MRNINDLVDYETVEDIFLELNDYGKFSFLVYDVISCEKTRNPTFMDTTEDDFKSSYIIHTCELVKNSEDVCDEISQFGYNQAFKIVNKKFRIEKTPKIGKIYPGDYWSRFKGHVGKTRDMILKDEELHEVIKRCKSYLGDDLYKISIQRSTTISEHDVIYMKFNSYEAIEINE
jgi:hypothetical protein